MSESTLYSEAYVDQDIDRKQNESLNSSLRSSVGLEANAFFLLLVSKKMQKSLINKSNLLKAFSDITNYKISKLIEHKTRLLKKRSSVMVSSANLFGYKLEVEDTASMPVYQIVQFSQSRSADREIVKKIVKIQSAYRGKLVRFVYKLTRLNLEYERECKFLKKRSRKSSK